MTRSRGARRSTGSICSRPLSTRPSSCPSLNIRFGVELLLRLVPGIGDAAASAMSCYLLFEARRLGVPRLLFARMVMNVLLEGTVGAVPIAGDAFDVIFRANRRNVALLREHFAKVGY